mgnify:CR=1 FL=1
MQLERGQTAVITGAASGIGFALAEGTDREAGAAMAVLDLSSSRVGDELRRLLEEDAAPVALALAKELQLGSYGKRGERGDRPPRKD